MTAAIPLEPSAETPPPPDTARTAASPRAVDIELFEQLGSGTHGIVWLARYRTASGIVRHAAVKVLRTGFDDLGPQARRLRDEARMLALLRHRAVGGFVDLVSVDGRPALVTEYVDGTDLRDLLRAGPLSTRATAELVAELGSALEAAHAGVPDSTGRRVEVIHRDIKPANVRVTPWGEPVLLDFGAGKALLTQRESQSGIFTLGTPGYVAPEAVLGDVSAAADVFGLGVLTWECATGEALGSLSGRPDTYKRQLELALERLPDPDLGALVGPMLSWTPEDRPSAGDIAMQATELARLAQSASLRLTIERYSRRGGGQPEATAPWRRGVVTEDPHPAELMEATGTVEHTVTALFTRTPVPPAPVLPPPPAGEAPTTTVVAVPSWLLPAILLALLILGFASLGLSALVLWVVVRVA